MKISDINLIPNIVNPSPDYYCTWQTQLYATCDGKPERQRAVIGEKALFAEEKPFGWASFYEKARGDLLFVMDDSWDVPLENDGTYYGCLQLNGEKFPDSVTYAETATEAMKRLSERMKSLGWKGLGGWVCAQESVRIDKDASSREYWKNRLLEADRSGFAYWKVDWGKRADDADFRRMLTELGRKYAPKLIIEHAVTKNALPFCEVFRTYDVPAVMSIPMTLQKLADIYSGDSDELMGIVNCEDEAYIAAAGGFSMGIMRHPYSGKFINGKADMSFPEIGRNIKTKIYEVTRAARWHRAAPAFKGSAAEVKVSRELLCDNWSFVDREAEIEAWWFDSPLFSDDLKDGTVRKSAPCQLARNCELAEVTPDKNGNVPYIVSSQNPNGVFSVAALGRTQGRVYSIPNCDVSIDIGESELVGIFGEYASLFIKTDIRDVKKILMQDIADNVAFDVTDEVVFKDNGILILGELIHRIGTVSQKSGDTSEPGAALRLCRE